MAIQPESFFIGPLEGGMKVQDTLTGTEIVVITPASPLGRDLISRCVGDLVRLKVGTGVKEFEITGIC
jgi:transcription elongation GreA/GreB family factor